MFDAIAGRKIGSIFKGMDARVLVIAFKSDWLYPAYQSQEIVRACKLAGIDVTYCEVDSNYGHDAFLLESEEETILVKFFLEKLYHGEITSTI